jgi:cytochrome c oxidase subunit 2
VRLTNGTEPLVNDAYLREAILNPSAEIVAGFAPIMPTYQGQITEDGLIDLVEYIKGMKTNDRLQQTMVNAESKRNVPTTPTVIKH